MSKKKNIDCYDKEKKIKVITGKENCNVVTIYTSAKSFKLLVDLIKSAEIKMVDNGMKTAEERIGTLRGIFYGTPWSMDFLKEKSESRNFGMQTYTASTMPKDPRPIIGEAHYKAIMDSAEVRDNGRFTDFGHLIIGLHSRCNLISRKVILPTAGTGLESVTWLGDIGGGTGMLAYKRISNKNYRARQLFDDGHNYGAPTNLEGDIASYLIAPGDDPFDGPSAINIKEGEFVADYMEKYFDEQGSLWKNRAKFFLSHLGAKFENDEITNLDKCIEKTVATCVQFGLIYMTLRLRDQNKLTKDILLKMELSLFSAAREMVVMFYDALIFSYKNNGSMIARRTDPDPLPSINPEESTIHKANKKLEEIFKEWGIKVDKGSEKLKDIYEDIFKIGKEWYNKYR